MLGCECLNIRTLCGFYLPVGWSPLSSQASGAGLGLPLRRQLNGLGLKSSKDILEYQRSPLLLFLSQSEQRSDDVQERGNLESCVHFS